MFLEAWKIRGEFEDGFIYDQTGPSEAYCIETLYNKYTPKHGELVYYTGVNDEYYIDGEYFEN